MTENDPQPAVPKPKRWYCVTPDRAASGLLTLECLLWLSGRYHWFAFNEHKGWTVLIAIGAVLVAVLMLLFWFVASLLFRWRFQFSIRSLLVLTVVVAAPCGWLSWEMGKARQQRGTVTEIHTAGGSVLYDYQTDEQGLFISGARPARWAWLGELFGRDFFGNPCHVYIHGHAGGDVPGGQVTVIVFDQEQCLNPDRAPFGDADLERIGGLTDLKTLSLSGTRITDAGLPHLAGLTQLQELDLANTQITDAAMEHLARLPQLQYLDLENTRITDAGLAELRELEKLREVFLEGTQASEQGIGEFARALPNCDVRTDYFRWTGPGMGMM